MTSSAEDIQRVYLEDIARKGRMVRPDSRIGLRGVRVAKYSVPSNQLLNAECPGWKAGRIR
jgi:hypothetical protein